MSNKGNESTVTSTATYDKVIVAAGAYSNNVGSLADDLVDLARKLNDPDEGILSGGDGDQLIQAARALKDGCERLKTSNSNLIATLDENLMKTINLGKGNYSDSVDANKKTANKVGVMSKN